MAIKKRKTMLKVRHNKVFEVQGKDIYSGERSPYRDSIGEEAHERAIANPDILDESAAMYYRSIDDMAPLKMQIIKECLPILTGAQKMALYCCGIKDLSQEEAAEALHCTQQAISNRLEGARKKIMKKYLHRVSQQK